MSIESRIQKLEAVVSSRAAAFGGLPPVSLWQGVVCVDDEANHIDFLGERSHYTGALPYYRGEVVTEDGRLRAREADDPEDAPIFAPEVQARLNAEYEQRYFTHPDTPDNRTWYRKIGWGFLFGDEERSPARRMPNPMVGRDCPKDSE